MKSDLDTSMQDHNLDAILVTGPGQHNPPMVYLTGGGHLTRADLIKKRGQPPVLFCNSMEREEGARTGLETRNVDDYRIEELLKQHNGDQMLAISARYQQMFADLGLTSGPRCSLWKYRRRAGLRRFFRPAESPAGDRAGR